MEVVKLVTGETHRATDRASAIKAERIEKRRSLMAVECSWCIYKGPKSCRKNKKFVSALLLLDAPGATESFFTKLNFVTTILKLPCRHLNVLIQGRRERRGNERKGYKKCLG